MNIEVGQLRGSGGGGKGGGSEFRNRPDNLRSTDTYEMLIGLGTGRIRLAPGGLTNLFVDDVPVEDSVTHQATFKDFAAGLFDGDPATLVPVKLRLGASSGMQSVGVALANNRDNAPGDWVYGAVPQVGVDYIDLRFMVQQLFAQTEKGIFNTTATIEIELRPSGTANWINPLMDTTGPDYNVDGGTSNKSGGIGYILAQALNPDGSWDDAAPGFLQIKGKTTSPYVREYRIGVPSDGAYANKSWEIRCRLMEIDYKVSGDKGQNETHREIVWESCSGVSNKPIGGTEDWRGLSYLQIYGKASDQINGVPEVTGIYDLNDYMVPPSTVWDPKTRLYTGAAWDGITQQLAWTSCPAWQIKGLIEDGLSGVSALVPGSTLNKWDTLEASKWFAELVPDGKGGTHPRYSGHWYLESPMQCQELVNYLAGAVGAHCWDEGDGHWRMKVEKPETPAMVFTKENIVGEFIYSHTDWDTRYNDFIGVFRNEEKRYIEDRVRIRDPYNISATGRRHQTIALVGCDNRQEALRRLKIRLLTSLNETRMVTFQTNRLAGLLEPLSVIAVADGDLNSDTAMRSTGRIVKLSQDRVQATVRDSLRLEVGINYQVHVTVPNPNYDPETTDQPSHEDWRKPTINITRNVVNTNLQRGDIYDLYLDQPLPADLPDHAVLSLSALGLPALPKQYRVLALQHSEDGEKVTVSAAEIYTAKWVESDNVSEDDENVEIITRLVPTPTAPTDGFWKTRTFNTETMTKRVLVADWERPPSFFLDKYRIEYRHNHGPWQDYGTTRDTFFELQQPEPGIHEMRVYAVDRRGSESLPLEAAVDLEDIVTATPAAYLTNESHSVAAYADGTGFELSDANGLFVLYNSLGPIETGVVYSVVTESGMDVTINAATGAYQVVDLTADNATAKLRAVYKTFTIERTFSVSKSKAGVQGDQGPGGPVVALHSDSQGFLFVDGEADPAVQTITLTAEQQNTDGAVSWSTSPAVTLGGAADALVRTLSLADFAANRQVVVTVTDADTGAKDTLTVVRLDYSTAAANADVTANSQIIVAGMGDATIQCDYLGEPKTDELPFYVVPVVTKGGVSIRRADITTYAVVGSGCTVTINNTVDDAEKGWATVTAMTGNTAFVDITVTVNGFTQPTIRTTITKVMDEAPPPPVTTAPPQAKITSYTTVTSNVYDDVAEGGPVMVKTGATGKLDFVAPLEFLRAGKINGSSAARGKWQYRTPGGVWIDVGPEIASTSSAYTETTTEDGTGGGGGEIP